MSSWKVDLAALGALVLLAAGCVGGTSRTPASDTRSPTVDSGAHTVVPGASWTARLVLNSSRITLRHLVCAGETHCIATGSLTGDGGGSVIGPAVLDSADSGTSWSMSSLPSDTQRLDISDVACVDELRCIGVANGGGQNGKVLTTSDGGAKWDEHDAPDGTAPTAVSCSGSDCMVAGARDDGKLDTFTSGDGGATWNQSGSPAVDAHEVFSLACPTADRCYLTTSTNEPDAFGFELFVTDDRGSSWRERTPSGQSLVDDLECLGKDDCLVTGLRDIVQTSDGGEHWARRFRGFNAGDARAVSCSPSGLCIGVGEQATVIRSDDGGRNWTREPLPAGAATRIDDVSCVLPSGCVAVAQSEQVSVATPPTYRFGAVILTRSGQ